jgi:hypothetical protein
LCGSDRIALWKDILEAVLDIALNPTAVREELVVQDDIVAKASVVRPHMALRSL